MFEREAADARKKAHSDMMKIKAEKDRVEAAVKAKD